MTSGPTEDKLQDAFAAFLLNAVGNVLVGRLDDSTRAALGAMMELVFLSPDTLNKQKREHPELTPDEYMLLPSVLEAPDLVLLWGALRIAVLKTGSHDLVAVVKTTVE